MPAQSQTLSPLQLAAYLAHLRVPSSPTLTQLVAHHLRYVPFESLSLHYTPTPGIDISLAAVYAKVVGAGAGRGGYCMEVNTLFCALLRTLGFSVFTTGARVSTAVTSNGKDTSGDFTGWNHKTLLVKDAGAHWLVDVGFGGK